MNFAGLGVARFPRGEEAEVVCGASPEAGEIGVYGERGGAGDFGGVGVFAGLVDGAFPMFDAVFAGAIFEVAFGDRPAFGQDFAAKGGCGERYFGGFAGREVKRFEGLIGTGDGGGGVGGDKAEVIDGGQGEAGDFGVNKDRFGAIADLGGGLFAGDFVAIGFGFAIFEVTAFGRFEFGAFGVDFSHEGGGG